MFNIHAETYIIKLFTEVLETCYTFRYFSNNYSLIHRAVKGYTQVKHSLTLNQLFKNFRFVKENLFACTGLWSFAQMRLKSVSSATETR